jgi:hypothetical protein
MFLKNIRSMEIHQLLISLTVLTGILSTNINVLSAQTTNKLYNPIKLIFKDGKTEINDKLSAQDIPISEGGFARDYVIKLNAKDQVIIDLSSDNFDTILKVMNPTGSTVVENDDSPEGGTNSQLFLRAKNTQDYVIRVRGFGETANGDFNLKITQLYDQKLCPK